MISRLIKETLRVLDGKKAELECARKKFPDKYDFIDVEARNTFKKCTTSMIKCSHGCNHCGLRDALMNGNMVEATCPRCGQIESWDHIVKCDDTKSNRAEFIRNLMLELVSRKPDSVDVNEIMSFMEDILRCFDNEIEEEYETNQYFVGMQNLFRGHAVKT